MNNMSKLVSQLEDELPNPASVDRATYLKEFKDGIGLMAYKEIVFESPVTGLQKDRNRTGL